MSAEMMSDGDWLALLRAGSDEGWRLVWDRVIAPEAKSQRSAEMMRRFSLTDGDLMGMLYSDMIGRRKIDLFRNDGGSLQGWLRTYVRGYVLNADPNRHGEISIEGAHADAENGDESLSLPRGKLKLSSPFSASACAPSIEISPCRLGSAFRT